MSFLRSVVLASLACSPCIGAEPSWVSQAALATTEFKRTWVFFRDKALTPDSRDAALRMLAETYDHHAILRRQLRRTDPGLFDDRDLPIAEPYLDAIRASGATVHIESTWLNAVSIIADPAAVDRIRALPFVLRVQPVRGGARIEPTDPRAPEQPLNISFMPRGPSPEGAAAPQQAQIGLNMLHSQGFTGTGVIIGILDSGFKRTHVAFNQPGHVVQVVAEHDFVFNDNQTANEPEDDPTQHNHGTYCLGLIGAYLPGTYMGGAYDASFILCKTEDVRSETPIEEDNYVAGLQYIEAHGGDMATASLGYIDWYTQADLNGATAVTTIGVNVATANGLICCNAAGNEGHDANPATNHLIAPADALKVITVGAVDSSGASASFTSDGPSADGRVKPEVLAWGVNNVLIRAGNDTDLTSGSGTSFATPLAASVVACLLQAHPTWTVAQMRGYLFTSADYYVANHTFEPAYVRGYGIINGASAVQGDCNRDGLSDAAQLDAGTLGDCNHNGLPDACEPPCRPDFDGSGCLNVNDIFAFLTAWFAHDPRADYDADGAISIQDVFAFIAGWFGGCSGSW